MSSLGRRAFLVVWLSVIACSSCGRDRGDPDEPGAACGAGSWRPGTLEIHHLALGQADATLIVGPTGRSLLIDVGETAWDASDGARTVGASIEATLGCRRLDYVLITHFHLDHVGYVGR